MVVYFFRLAEQKKENGNQLYKVKQYKSALNLYTEAIELCPQISSYYSNRSACHMMLSNHREALEDARKATHLDPTLTKGYVRILKCAIALGEITTAENVIKQLNQLKDKSGINMNNETQSFNKLKQFELEAQKADGKKDFRKVIYCMDRCLDEAPTCTRYKLIKAEHLAFLGRYQEAQEIANNILHLDKSNADAIYVRGICLYYEDNLDSAFSHFQQVLRLAPDHKKAMDIYKRAKELKKKKEQGNDLYKNCKFQEAFQLYTEALAVDPLNKRANAKLFFNRATVQHRLAKIREAVEDCTAALDLDDVYLKALLRRASCYMDLGEFDDAVRDYEKVCKLNKSREHRKLLQDAKFALKKSKRKDYYRILGVDRNASENDIKKAYRKKALVLHPDRHSSATDAVKKDQEKKFKELGEAYGILSDAKKKARYDSGQDLDDMDVGMPGKNILFNESGFALNEIFLQILIPSMYSKRFLTNKGVMTSIWEEGFLAGSLSILVRSVV